MSIQKQRKQTDSLQAILMTITLLAGCFSLLGQTNPTNTVHTLFKSAYMGQSASNELIRISIDETLSAETRQKARNAAQFNKLPATNSYEEIQEFLAGWSVMEEPPLNDETFTLMRTAIQLGASALNQLQQVSADTNMPPTFRQWAGDMSATLLPKPTQE